MLRAPVGEGGLGADPNGELAIGDFAVVVPDQTGKWVILGGLFVPSYA
jgi:hypothetical protein